MSVQNPRPRSAPSESRRLRHLANPVLLCLFASVSFFALYHLWAVTAHLGSAPWLDCITISQTTAVIDRPGRYCLRDDLEAAGKGISIEADEVELDLQGHALIGPATPTVTVPGIQATDHHSIHIHNGTVRGFLFGVRIDVSDLASLRAPDEDWNIRVDHLRLEDNTFRALRIDGIGVTVHDVVAARTGGARFVDSPAAMGIEIYGGSCSVTRSRVTGLRTVGEGERVGIAISAFGTHSCKVSENVVELPRETDGGRSIGIWFGGEPDTGPMRARDNRIRGFDYAISYASDIDLDREGNEWSGVRCAPVLGGVDGEVTLGEDCPDNLQANLRRARSGDTDAMFRLAQVLTEPTERFAWAVAAATDEHAEAERLAGVLWQLLPEEERPRALDATRANCAKAGRLCAKWVTRLDGCSANAPCLAAPVR